MKKRIVGLLWGLAAAGTESLCLDAAWVAEATNGVTFKMSVNGSEKARVGAYGAWNWSEARPGTYAVTAQAYQDGALVGETLAATFAVRKMVAGQSKCNCRQVKCNGLVQLAFNMSLTFSKLFFLRLSA